MFNVHWHVTHGEMTTSSAEVVIAKLAQFLPFNSVLDVGCGDGRWLSVIRGRGVDDIAGVDGPWNDPASLYFPADRFHVQDLHEPFDLGRRFDLVMSLEVAEHVAQSAAATFVGNLTRHGDVVLFSAAVPYQGGYRHINEQWPSYWETLFAQHGFLAFDPLRSQIWTNNDVHVWYKQNTLLYVHRDSHPVINAVEAYIREHQSQQMPRDVVHPDRYVDVATYEVIIPKPFIRQVTRKVFSKLRESAVQAISRKPVAKLSA
ncbi:MAG: methyltransferase domain-containing protein [Rhodopila sp.]